MKNSNVCIWEIEKTLDEIKILLKKDYYEIHNDLMNEGIDEKEITFFHKWTGIEGNEFNIKEANLYNNTIKYIEALATVEGNSIKQDDWIVEGNLLPRELRISRNISKVYFISFLGKTYCLVIGSKTSEGRIRSKLMENGRGKKKTSSWGEVGHTKVFPYVFDKKFYYWILKNKGTILKIEDKNLELLLSDVRGFKGSADRSENSYSGKGYDISNEIPLKALVSLDENLISLFIDVLIDKKIKYSFVVHSDGRIELCEGECGEFGTQPPRFITLKEAVMYIYFFIIPQLIKGFNKERSNPEFDKNLETFQKKLSIDIILDLMKQNSLNLKELELAVTRKSCN